MSDLQIKGTIVSKFDVQTFETKSGKDFTKQEFVIETDGEYTQTIKMECTNASVDNLKECNVGDTCNFYFNLRGRKYEKEDKVMYFNSIQVWRIEVLDTALIPDVPAAKLATTENTETNAGDGLPF
jgi:hypothetical protein